MKTECSNCHVKMNAPENYIGKNAVCPNCKQSFLIRSIEDAAQNKNTECDNNTQKPPLVVNDAVNCGNCDAHIGKLEKKYKWQDYVVCEKCFQKLTQVIRTNISNDEIKKPGKFSAIAGMRMAAGICDILAGLIFCWLIFPLVMIPFGIIEIISACNLLKEKPDYPKNIKMIAILEVVSIITMAGWISIISGIITLAFLSDDKVKEYLVYLKRSIIPNVSVYTGK